MLFTKALAALFLPTAALSTLTFASMAKEAFAQNVVSSDGDIEFFDKSAAAATSTNSQPSSGELRSYSSFVSWDIPLPS